MAAKAADAPVLPKAPEARDEMSTEAFDTVMKQGLEEAKADRSRPAGEVFAELRRII